jgi:transposase
LLELFLPDVSGLLLEKSYAVDKRLLLFLSSTGPSAICPKCQVVSTKIHRHYTRIVADLPWAELAIRFLLRVRRFFCHNSRCKRVTFAERLGEAIPRTGYFLHPQENPEALKTTSIRFIESSKGRFFTKILDI